MTPRVDSTRPSRHSRHRGPRLAEPTGVTFRGLFGRRCVLLRLANPTRVVAQVYIQPPFPAQIHPLGGAGNEPAGGGGRAGTTSHGCCPQGTSGDDEQADSARPIEQFRKHGRSFLLKRAHPNTSRPRRRWLEMLTKRDSGPRCVFNTQQFVTTVACQRRGCAGVLPGCSGRKLHELLGQGSEASVSLALHVRHDERPSAPSDRRRRSRDPYPVGTVSRQARIPHDGGSGRKRDATKKKTHTQKTQQTQPKTPWGRWLVDLP